MHAERLMADYGFSSHFTCILGEEQYFNLKRTALSQQSLDTEWGDMLKK